MNANYSSEFIFDDVRRRLASEVDSRVVVAPFCSNGVIRRAVVAGHAWWSQGDITHVTGDINFAAIAMNPRRTVLTVLDCGFINRTRGVRRLILKYLWLTLPLRRAGVVTTISNAARDEIVRHAGCDIRGKIRVVPVAISEEFQPCPAVFNVECPRILQVGTAPNKNLSRVIESLKGLHCTLVVIGPIEDATRDAALAAGIRVENYVDISRLELIEQYQRCDIVAFASTYEGFGMPIVEANAVGRVVLTSNVCSMPEVAGRAACLVDPFSVASIRHGFERIFSESSYRDELVRLGHQNALRFCGQAIANKYLEVYREIAEGTMLKC